MSTETEEYVTNPQPATLLAAMKRHGVTIRAVFVPWSQSRNRDEKETNYATGKPSNRPSRSLNWKVTVLRSGRDILTTDYMAGSGHCPASKASVKELGNQNSLRRDGLIAFECEHGFAARHYSETMPLVANRRHPLLPSSPDVVYSLIQDADVLNCASFEAWAAEFEYDPDSRSAESIYRACLAIALQLRNGLGEDILADLSAAAQDY